MNALICSEYWHLKRKQPWNLKSYRAVNLWHDVSSSPWSLLCQSPVLWWEHSRSPSALHTKHFRWFTASTSKGHTALFCTGQAQLHWGDSRLKEIWQFFNKYTQQHQVKCRSFSCCTSPVHLQFWTASSDSISTMLCFHALPSKYQTRRYILIYKNPTIKYFLSRSCSSLVS